MFEILLVNLFVAMGYGGTMEEAGRPGDDGVDVVINQDPLGVDQIYLQAKRYALGNNIGTGALDLKQATKGISVS